jgi:two-component system sensor histidine kinase AlgZ
MALNVFVGLVVSLVLARLHTTSHDQALRVEIFSSLVHSTIYGLSFGLPMPYLAGRLEALRFPWNWCALLSLLIMISILSTFVVQILLFQFQLEGAQAFGSEVFYKTASVFVIASIIALIVHTYDRVREQTQATKLQLRTQELEKERALKLLSEARLSSLESRLHPHFLFNTLNSISALILEDPLLADEMVQRLAALLRASLDACEQDRVSLKQEIELAVDYLKIEQARFRERLSYSIDIPTELNSLSVPPITLQPLVENSVKFAVAARPSGGSIEMSARLLSGKLKLEVWDDGPGFTREMIRPGHGLDNLQSRLNVVFGEAAELSVAPKTGGTAVTVWLPVSDFSRGNRL